MSTGTKQPRPRRARIAPQLRGLPTDERERIERKWYRREPMTQYELATAMGISYQRVQQIEKVAMEKIRQALARQGMGFVKLGVRG